MRERSCLDHQQQLHALGRVAILAGLSPSALERVVTSCKWREFVPGQQILAYQDPSTDVHFLAAGRARVIIYFREGKAGVFTHLKARTMFCVISSIDPRPPSAPLSAPP